MIDIYFILILRFFFFFKFGPNPVATSNGKVTEVSCRKNKEASRKHLPTETGTQFPENMSIYYHAC